MQLSEIRFSGIGPKRLQRLRSQGIGTVDQLAGLSVQQLRSLLPRLPKATAEQAIALAKSTCDAAESTPPTPKMSDRVAKKILKKARRKRGLQIARELQEAHARVLSLMDWLDPKRVSKPTAKKGVKQLQKLLSSLDSTQQHTITYGVSKKELAELSALSHQYVKRAQELIEKKPNDKRTDEVISMSRALRKGLETVLSGGE